MPSAIDYKKRPSKALIEACRVITYVSSRLFWRIKFHNTENIPSSDFGGFVIVANHQTYMDPVWISVPIRHDIRYLAWDKVFEWPILGAAIKKLGAMPVSLDRGGTVSSLRASLKVLKLGAALVIFPEGEREYKSGELLKFRTGAVLLARKAGVPVLPVTIKGANRVWPQEYKFPRPGKVEIYYHPLIHLEPGSDKKENPVSPEQEVQRIREIIAKPLDN